MNPPSRDPPSVLFVCLGNICRSPLAQAAFAAEARRVGLIAHADSAGTGDWHVGEPPDPRAQRTARRHGVDISGYRGRQVERADFDRFTHILALDHGNLADLRRLAPADATARIGLLLDLVPGRAGEAVADPYFGDEAGFEVTWDEVTAAAEALVALFGG
jgi:protein-tyrosine phosphatase